MVTNIFHVVAFTQSYDWGKLGSTSKAAQYAARGSPDFIIDESKPYAELWMGTHPNLPSKLQTGVTLLDHIKAHPDLMGSTSASDLPFLFKILTIRKALSIQSHPNKKLARKLHAERPDIYKDPNHKPELAIALTPFRALCGFLPVAQIAVYLSTVPELASLIPATDAFLSISSSPNEDTTRPALREVFQGLMTASPIDVATALSKLITRYKSGGATNSEKSVAQLAIELNTQFPGDVGVFCVFLLNAINLNPGEAIFLGAGEPHAYVSGDILECMATSDNVLRAGLTPKPRDVPNLLTSLTYTSAPPSKHMIYPTAYVGSTQRRTLLYDPPIPEFSILRVRMRCAEEESHKAIDGPSILIVTKGTGHLKAEGQKSELKEGTVVFIGAGQAVSFLSGDNLELYRAFYEP